MSKLGIIFSVFFGILIGVVSALIWSFGYINYVKVMIPYALVFGIIVLITTAVLKATCGSAKSMERKCVSPTCRNVNLYSPLILITAALFVVFALFVLATVLPFSIRTIVAYVGCISFWVMLLSFISMIISIFRRCC